MANKPHEDERERIVRLLRQYNTPAARADAEDWDETREALEAEAAKFGLPVPWGKTRAPDYGIRRR